MNLNSQPLDQDVDVEDDLFSGPGPVVTIDVDEFDDTLDEFDDALGEIDDAVEPLDLDTFDPVAFVANLDLYDLADAERALGEARKAYVKAAQAAGIKGAGAEFYQLVNGPLFRRRQAALAELAELAEVDGDFAHRRRVRRATLTLDAITDVIVRFNQGMALTYVRRFTSNTSPLDSEEFHSAALLGLMSSVATFDPDRGKFGSWAYKRIQREVLRAVREADYKSLNHGDFERRPDVMKAYAELAGPNEDYSPTFEEVAAKVGCTVALVKRVLAAPRLDSLQGMIGADGDTELGDLLPNHDVPVDEQVITALDVDALTKYGLPTLDAREHYVLARRYGLDGEPVQCLSTIGKQLRLSREAVRQIEAKALARLLHPATLSRIVRHGRA